MDCRYRACRFALAWQRNARVRHLHLAMPRAFSSEVDAGSRRENATKQKLEPRSDSIGTGKALVMFRRRLMRARMRWCPMRMVRRWPGVRSVRLVMWLAVRPGMSVRFVLMPRPPVMSLDIVWRQIFTLRRWWRHGILRQRRVSGLDAPRRADLVVPLSGDERISARPEPQLFALEVGIPIKHPISSVDDDRGNLVVPMLSDKSDAVIQFQCFAAKFRVPINRCVTTRFRGRGTSAAGKSQEAEA